MKKFILIFLLLPSLANASFMFQYGLNYAQSSDSTSADDHDFNRMFNKVFLGASINGGQNVIFGWNINSWSSTLTKDAAEDEYSILEMGPRILWFLNEGNNFYVSAEWNPYAKGSRTKSSVDSDISGSSLGFSTGYRFRLSRLIGLGASLNYHSLSLSKETISSTESSISDKIGNIMPMLEITLLTR